MNDFKILNSEEEKKLGKEEIKKYYLSLREYYANKAKNDCANSREKDVHKFFEKIARGMRKYSFAGDVQNGNIKKSIYFDEPVIFACNHSNTHDYYTVQEVFKRMVNVLAGEDCLNAFTKFLFRISGSELIDREDKVSSFNSVNNLVYDLAKGNDVLIFPESTWNIHPSKIMLPMKLGVIKVAAKSGCPIVPVIFEYVEKNEFCSKETELYDMCIIKFGEPIYVDPNDNFLEKLEHLKEAMSTMRWDIWSSFGAFKREELDEEIYYNHTELKCNSLLFKYDWIKEQKYIYGSSDYIYKDYPINRVMPAKRIKKLMQIK